MNRKLTVRIAPQCGEPLSILIMRAGKANQIPFKYMMRYLSDFEGDNISKRPYMLDIYPLKSETYEFLHSFTGIDINVLNSMTFMPVYSKFLDCIDNKANIKCNIDKNVYVKDKRRFCTNCIKEKGGYKLIWQISDLDMCNLHHTKLTSKCHNCSVEQPYTLNDSDIYRCFNCNAILYENSGEYVCDENIISEQIRKYRDWTYLLDNDMRLANCIEGFSVEKSLAINFLYCLQQGNNHFNVDAWGKHFNKNILYYVLNLITDRLRVKRIIISDLFNLLDIIHKDVEEFAKTIVPARFIESIFDYCKRDEIEPGVCSTPWCSCLGSNKKMKKIVHNEYNKTDYIHIHFCLECSMLYGYSKKSNKWGLIDDFVDMVCRVLPIIKLDVSKDEISKKTGISRNVINKVVGYIASHELSSCDLLAKCTPDYIPGDILEKFKLLLNTEGIKKKQAKKLFNWGENEYFYFLMLGSVQEFLLCNSYKFTNRKYKDENELKYKIMCEIENAICNNDKISIEKIKKQLKVDDKTISRHGCKSIMLEGKEKQKELEINRLQKKVDDFLNENKLVWNKITLNDIYNYIGVSRHGVSCLDHNLLEWISQKNKEYNFEYKTHIEMENENLIRMAMRRLYSSGKELSYLNISIESGISTYIIYKHNNIKQAIQKEMMLINNRCGY